MRESMDRGKLSNTHFQYSQELTCFMILFEEYEEGKNPYYVYTKAFAIKIL